MKLLAVTAVENAYQVQLSFSMAVTMFQGSASKSYATAGNSPQNPKSSMASNLSWSDDDCNGFAEEILEGDGRCDVWGP